MTFTDDQQQAIVEVVKAANAKLMRETPFVQYQPGTVVHYEEPTGGIPATAYVRMDGDTGDDAIACPVIIPHRVGEGERVMVVFSPPHAHYVCGVLFEQFVAEPTVPAGWAELYELEVDDGNPSGYPLGRYLIVPFDTFEGTAAFYEAMEPVPGSGWLALRDLIIDVDFTVAWNLVMPGGTYQTALLFDDPSSNCSFGNNVVKGVMDQHIVDTPASSFYTPLFSWTHNASTKVEVPEGVTVGVGVAYWQRPGSFGSAPIQAGTVCQDDTGLRLSIHLCDTPLLVEGGEIN